MSRLEAKSTLKNTVKAALRWVICLPLLLGVFGPIPVQALPPKAHDDYFTVLEDSDDRDNRLDVLRNDENWPGDPFEIVGVTQGDHGSVEIVLEGTLVSYKPDPNYAGPDDFTYTIDDGFGRNVQATVYIAVKGINDRPVVNDDTATTNEDLAIEIAVLDNDYDIDGNLNPASVRRISGPSQGRVTIDESNGHITYSPNTDWHGQDTFTYHVCDDGSPTPVKCAQANVTVTVRPVSDRPIANAGPDQSIPTLSLVTLDGSSSYDPDGDTELSYEWRQTGGAQQVALSDPTAQSPTFVAPDDPDVLVFSLTVYDDFGQASVNTDNWTRVTVTNQTPVANAGDNQVAFTETRVTLDGSASQDPDHDQLTFEWIQTGGPTVTFNSAIAESPTFTAPATATSLTFALRVKDEYGARSTYDETKVDVYKLPIFSLYLPSVVSNHATMPDLVVKSIAATKHNIQIVIENRGSAAVTQGFYVDAYVNPKRAPIGANEGWDTPGVSSGRGLVWAIEVAQAPKPAQGIIAPLMPGDSLTLNVKDAFYQPIYSHMTWPMAAGTPIYAQVDSYPDASPHDGLVLETHEYYNQTYNNIAGPVNSISAAGSTIAPMSRPQPDSRPAGLPPRP